MLSAQDLQLALDCAPAFFQDNKEPFPIRYLGTSIFRSATPSKTFPNLVWDPAAYGAALIIEYAIYFDYDIQHLYDLEHVWVAVNSKNEVIDCWSSFHGMRVHAAGLTSIYRMKGNHPVLYLQPGKHAVMPDPMLFPLHSQCHTCCTTTAGGGLLVPKMLEHAMSTNQEQNDMIRKYICERFTFEPSWVFSEESLDAAQFITSEELLDVIPRLVETQLQEIRSYYAK